MFWDRMSSLGVSYDSTSSIGRRVTKDVRVLRDDEMGVPL